MFHEIIALLMQPFWMSINHLAMFTVCGLAILAGNWRERFGGIIYMASFLLPELFRFSSSDRDEIVVGLVADALCLPGFVTINHKSPHAWTRWALLFLVLSVAGDLVETVMYDGRKPRAYVISEAILFYAILAALLIGTISAYRRRHRCRLSESGAPPGFGQD